MKEILILLLIFFMFPVCINAASADTLSAQQMNSKTMTPERLLGVPAVYTVESCKVFTTSKSGVFVVIYCKHGTSNCPNINAADFPALWTNQITSMGKSKGATITIDDIVMAKGNRTMKWQSKSFVAP